MKNTEDSKFVTEFNDYLKSIGGLKFGYSVAGEPILERWFFEVGDGWLPLVKELIEKLIDAGWNREVTQVKEKFAGLRFYINGGTDEIFNIIQEAEDKSYNICEICGKPGDVYTSGNWVYPRCSEHAPELTIPYSEYEKLNL